MPANIESMFSVRQMPWHREGDVLDDYPGTWAEARVLAGLDWEPDHHRCVRGDRRQRRRQRRCWNRSAAGKRSAAPTPAPCCRSTRTVTPSSATVRWARSSKPSWPSRASGGRPPGCSMVAGRCGAWPCSTNPSNCPATTAPTLPYLAITNRHDGTAACALRATAVRIVCANTFRAAELEGERTGATFSFIHKSSWRSRLDEARQAVTGARHEMRRYTELAHQLLGIPVTPRQRELFVTEFIPMPPTGLVTDRVARNVEEARAGPPADLRIEDHRAVAGTAYGLMQAAGEYLDHVRTARSWETRLNRTLIRPEPLKHRALSLIREVAAAA